MSSERNLIILLILAKLLALVSGQFCNNDNGNYTHNSTYQANLNSILSSLSTNIDPYGFYNASMGQNPDRANVMALCRGDTQLDTCRICVRNAAVDLVRSCPNQRQAILIGEYCMLRYSDQPIYGTRSTTPQNILYNIGNATSPNEFMRNLGTLIDTLSSRAPYGGSLLKLAAGNINSSNSVTINAILQCTPDLSADDCNNCLTSSAQELFRCCNTSLGVRVQRPSCSLHYETEHFYNETRVQELISVSTPPVPPPASTPPITSPPASTPPITSPSVIIPRGNHANNNTIRMVIIMVSVAAGLLLSI